MELKLIFLFFVFFLNNLKCQDNKNVVFKFRTNINLIEVTDENYMSKKLDQKLYVDLNIGQPAQIIPMTIKTWQYPTYIISNKDNGHIKIKFNPGKSYTYKEESPMPIDNVPKYDFSKGYYSKDILNMNPRIENFYFILATENGIGSKNISGEIGLSRENPQESSFIKNIAETNFIQQLIDNKLINQKIFGFLYDTEYEGRLIFGDYLYNVVKKYKQNDMIEAPLDINIPNNDYKMWHLKFDLRCQSGKDNTIIYAEKTFGFLFIEYGLIIGSTTFRNNFVNDYFNNKKCHNMTVAGSFHFTEYYCTDESQFEDFPNIAFIEEGKYQFSFTKDELFIKKGDKYIFQIVFELFTTEGVDYWKIGQPLFRKYAIFLKEEEKNSYKIAYYLNQKFNNDDEENGSNSLKTQTIVIIVLSIILGLLIIAIFIYFKYFYTKTRKKRVQELDERDFEYTPKEEPKDQLLADDSDD